MMMKLLLACVLLMYIVGDIGVNSACCQAKQGGRCNDGTWSTPCCAHSRCNWLCCGCRCRGKRDVSGKEQPDGFHMIDQNQNGHVDKDEAHSHLLSGTCGNFTWDFSEFENHFAKFDKDGDGKLSYAEVNAAG